MREACGNGLGKRLIEGVIADAREIGYGRIVNDNAICQTIEKRESPVMIIATVVEMPPKIISPFATDKSRGPPSRPEQSCNIHGPLDDRNDDTGDRLNSSRDHKRQELFEALEHHSEIDRIVPHIRRTGPIRKKLTTGIQLTSSIVKRPMPRSISNRRVTTLQP